MLRKKIFYLPVVSFSILLIIGFFVFKTMLTNWFVEYVNDELEIELNSLIRSIHYNKPDATPKSFNDFLININKNNEQFRITIINQQGDVLADTSVPYTLLDSLDNHANRVEISQAFKTGIGKSQRYSNTLETTMLYSAKRFKTDSFIGVLRLSTPVNYIDSLAWDLEVLFIALMVSVIFVSLLLTVLFNRHISHVLANEQSLQEKRINERTREIELLHRLASMLAACNSIDEAQQVAEDIIPRILGPLNGAISLIRSSRNLLEVKLDWGDTWPGAHHFSPDECWAMRKGKFHLANDHFTTLPCSHMASVGNDQTLCIPLVAHGNTIGLMHLYLGDTELSDDQFTLTFTIGEHIGLALANLNLQEKLRDQAIRDPLTGLYNRRFLEESMQHELMRTKRHKQSLSILALDIDHFKRFNDNFGHDAGDYVLKSIATLLGNTIRGEDILCRTGGEELTILLSNTTTEQAIVLANKLCRVVRELNLEFHQSSLGNVTMSIGIATYPQDSEDPDTLLKIADVALYKAKNNGRDQCLHATLADTVSETDETLRPTT